MLFYSTRNTKNLVTFQEGVFQGLAPDGGLYHPLKTPDLSALMESFSGDTPFVEMASALTAALLEDELKPEQAESICRRAFTFEPALAKVDKDISVLELFHGPSCAFKDFGASFLAACMEEFLKESDRKAVILTATSGDTGSAVARAFHKRDNIDVVILYPSGRVSPLQEKQLTTLGDNVIALEVEGSFDDCQRMVKQAFVDPELRNRLPLASANSINLGRLLPQSFYYVWAWTRARADNSYFAVPSGNFGNLTAGILAWTWGLKVPGFLAVTNRNDVVPQYLISGDFTPRASLQTPSNAMDVGDPSNFERLLAIFDGDREKMSRMIAQQVVTDEETIATIREVKNRTGYLMDPHTAVGYLGARRFLDAAGDGRKIITLSTAHPGKFQEMVAEALGSAPELPERLKGLLDLPKRAEKIGGTLEDLKEVLLSRHG